MLKINNVELELDLFDADVAEKYENAIKNLQEKEKKNSVEGKTLSQIIRNQCILIFDFFNEVWGPGTDKKVFGNKTNYKVCVQAFKDVVQYTANFQKELKSFKIKK